MSLEVESIEVESVEGESRGSRWTTPIGREDLPCLVLRIALGVFFFFEGVEKLSWLGSSEVLAASLGQWAETAPAPSLWYLEAVAIPGAPLFSRLVVLGEFAAGIAFLSGRSVRLAAIVTFLMVLNIHFAHGTIFYLGFLTQGDALPVLGSLLALALLGTRRA